MNPSLDRIDLNQISYVTHPPLLSDLKAFLLGSRQEVLQGQVLSPNQKNLRIDFQVLSSFTSGKEDLYTITLIRNGKVVLEYGSSESYVEFIDLKPGSYDVEVRGSNIMDVSSEASVFSFRLKPHFTQTKAFIILIFLVLSGLAFWIIRSRNKRKETRFQYLRALDQETIKYQEATLAKFKLQMNPHFVYNTLNSIQYLFFDDKKKKQTSTSTPLQAC